MCKMKKIRGKTEPNAANGDNKQAVNQERHHNVDDVADNDEYSFSISEGYVFGVDNGTVQLNVGGAILKDVLIDSGASFNFVVKETWGDLEKARHQIYIEKRNAQCLSTGLVEGEGHF